MAKVPGFAQAFVGRWRIVEMDVWDSDFLGTHTTRAARLTHARGSRERYDGVG
ncbi:hypothetical protein ACVIHI_008507 [Bradyrhizobium sp. USDA 4524]|uniref:hypothetical protein n=1 Tax=unclassified Bradyrhizobium TaxID=2631580 RepID=UPI0020A1B888|nr:MULTISPECIES: hypothetical protein [unclassified Bradyrhizobium]MCP1846032.1 hypothetical protein [Bradyrhizobium sp. USDA 4538]MCP1907334.1 hypothetical protein [Bradyrhizobium sp. USDA 4537]MCP1985120.1 hypothetical protein [Bradyrhizobium sp. USDA 4539]